VGFVQSRLAAGLGDEVSVGRVRERLRAYRAIGRAAPDRHPPNPNPGTPPDEPRGARPNADLGRRRYGWSPSVPKPPHGTEVDPRLGRVDERLSAPRGVVARDPGFAPAPEPPHALGLRKENRSDLQRRRYDWTPAPAGIDDADLSRRGGKGAF
jgi:hypothetical protein